MKPKLALMLIVVGLLIANAWAQSNVPQTYSASMEAQALGLDKPTMIEIYRDGPRERIAVGPLVMLFDFEKHLTWWHGMSGPNSCSTGTFNGANAPKGQDMIAGGREAWKDKGGGELKLVKKEAVNGIPASQYKVVGAKPDHDWVASRVWVADQGFVVKVEGGETGKPPATVMEMKKFSTDKPDAALLKPPANCPATPNFEMDEEGSMHAHAEMSVNVQAHAGVDVGSGTKHSEVSVTQSSGAKTTTNKQAAVTEVKLDVKQTPFDDACGTKLEVNGKVKTSGAGKVWYRIYANIGGLVYAGGQDGYMDVGDDGQLALGKDVTMPISKSGEMRLQVGMMITDTRHAPTVISNVVPFKVVCKAK